MDFFLALIDHMKQVHPIDETRIYVSGFSMGGMMSNALACSYPDIVAAAAPCNAFNEGYFGNLESLLKKRSGAAYDPAAKDEEVAPSPVRQMADSKKAAYDYQVPVIQTAGLVDGKWPIDSETDARLKTFYYWRGYNHLNTDPFVQDMTNESGIHADETTYDGDDQRFLHHRWFNGNGVSMYELFLAKRCPHALDIRTTTYAWQFLKRFSRNSDGSLSVSG